MAVKKLNIRINVLLRIIKNIIKKCFNSGVNASFQPVKCLEEYCFSPQLTFAFFKCLQGYDKNSYRTIEFLIYILTQIWFGECNYDCYGLKIRVVVYSEFLTFNAY